MAGYVSPMPKVTGPRTLDRKTGEYVQGMRHRFPDGTTCAPSGCRECWREANWKAGQTHG